MSDDPKDPKDPDEPKEDPKGDPTDPDPKDPKDPDEPKAPQSVEEFQAALEQAQADAEKWKRLSRQNERAARKAQDELDQAKGKGPKNDPKPEPKKDPDDDKPDLDAIREQARREALTETLKDRALDKLEARAASKFADPEVAVALLRDKAGDFANGDKLDTEAIDDALADLLERKPHLAKDSRKGDDGKDKPRFKGSGDGGPKDTKPTRPRSLTEAVAAKLSPTG